MPRRVTLASCEVRGGRGCLSNGTRKGASEPLRISQRSIEAVREAANITEVASEFTALRRAGARFTGLCPFPDHDEKTPSFSVTPEKGFYHCFGCGKGGDAIKLVMELKPLPFAEAVSYLADRCGIELELEGRSPQQEHAARQRSSQRRSAHKALAAATAYYHKFLLKSPSADHARNYLKNRGFEQSTIEEFRLGYAPGGAGAGFGKAAQRVGLERGGLEAAGLLSGRGGDRFFDRIMFPISDPRGRIVGFGARTLGDAKPKYLNSPETDLFNKRALVYGFPQVAQAIRREKSVLVVEGYTDVLMLYQCGVQNAVATLGTAMTEQHLKALSAYADTIHLLFDPDDAGEKAVERASVTAAELRLDLRVLRLTDDPADWLLEHSADEFHQMLSGSVPVLEYAFRRRVERARGSSAAERSRMMSEMKELISKIHDPVFAEDAVRLGSEALGVRPDLLRPSPSSSNNSSRAVYGFSGNSTGSATLRERRTSSDPLVEAGRELLAICIVRPDLARRPFREGVNTSSLAQPLMLTPDDFGLESHARVFALLSDRLVDDSEDRGTILADEAARPLLQALAGLQAIGDGLYPSDASLRVAWLRVGALSRERAKARSEDLDEKIRLHSEIQQFNRAAVEIGDLTLEP